MKYLQVNLLIVIFFGFKTVFAQDKVLPQPYPLVSANIEKYSKMSKNKDGDGIPILNFQGRKIYYPITISQVALHYYSNYIETSNASSKNEFLKLAYWLKNNFTDYGSWGGWLTNDSLEGSSYQLPDRWMSAMSQGFGLSVMIEAYALTGDEVYLNIAKKVLVSFKVSVVDGGVRSNWGTSVWYDEYPTVPEKHVLNGFIFALAGLYDYFCFTKDNDAKQLFDQGIHSLNSHLGSFDAGFNSFYSGSPNANQHNIASKTGGKYHDLHIAQLIWLYTVTDNNSFKSWAHKFLQYDFGDVSKYGIQPKYKSITASSTIDSKSHGVENLYDANWTYGTYWSSYKFPVELEVKFIRPVDGLYEFVLISTKGSIDESEFDIEIFEENSYQVVSKKLLGVQRHASKHHIALVHLFALPLYFDGIEKIKLKFKTHSKKVLALRELNFHYDMSQELEGMIKKLNYKRCMDQ